jgi:hypothetical protein
MAVAPTRETHSGQNVGTFVVVVASVIGASVA